jgi:hypothetical protein
MLAHVDLTSSSTESRTAMRRISQRVVLLINYIRKDQ